MWARGSLPGVRSGVTATRITRAQCILSVSCTKIWLVTQQAFQVIKTLFQAEKAKPKMREM